MKIRFEISGAPHPQGRPRFTKRGFAYTPTKTRQAAKAFMLQAMAHKPPTPITGAFSTFMIFEMPIPKSTSKKNRQLMLEGKTRHVKKPDRDNMEKFVLDCMQKCGFFIDDSQNDSWSGRVVYSENPKTCIEMEGAYRHDDE